MSIYFINLFCSLFIYSPPQVSQVKVVMPNKHYYSVDLSKFPEVGSKENNEVFLPIDKPSGNIVAILGRKVKSKL